MLAVYCLQMFSPAFASQIVDLTEIGAGSKPLGTGNTFNPSDESGSLFQNPAGISNVKKYSLTSMSGNVMGEVPYLMLGGAYRTQYGVFGIGYINASVSGIREATLVNGVPEITGNEANYGSGSLLIGYANEAKEVRFINNIKFLTDRNAKVGASLKFVNQGFSGAASFEGAGGGGFDLDLGTIIPINERLTGSIAIKNIIPGNNIRADELPMTITGGVAFKLPDRKLLTIADLSYTTRGFLLHLGAEWNPYKQIFLRGGFDQKPENIDYSLGVGTKVKGFTFDYAYRTFAGLSEMSTHYFSIGYIGEDPPVNVVKPKPVVKTPLPQPPVVPKPVIKQNVKKPIKAPVIIKKKPVLPLKK